MSGGLKKTNGLVKSQKSVRANMSTAYIKRLKVVLNKQKKNPVACLNQDTAIVSTKEIKHKQKNSVLEEARQRLESARFR